MSDDKYASAVSKLRAANAERDAKAKLIVEARAKFAKYADHLSGLEKALRKENDAIRISPKTWEAGRDRKFVCRYEVTTQSKERKPIEFTLQGQKISIGGRVFPLGEKESFNYLGDVIVKAVK
jgi:hypothetical protein